MSNINNKINNILSDDYFDLTDEIEQNNNMINYQLNSLRSKDNLSNEEKKKLEDLEAQEKQEIDIIKDLISNEPIKKTFQTTPIQTTPIQTTPIQTTPIQTTPIETTPIKKTKTKIKPTQTKPVKKTYNDDYDDYDDYDDTYDKYYN